LEMWDRLALLLIARAREGWEPKFEEITHRKIKRLAPSTAQVEREHDE
jgi:hypothetical protein